MIFNLFKSTPNDNIETISISNDMKKDAKEFIETILSKANFNAIVAINNDVDDLIYFCLLYTSDAADE